MTATLDQLLALLPDNTTGEISAADIRTIVTELYGLASTYAQQYAYRWSSTSTPSPAHLAFDLGWSLTSTSLHISETTDTGIVLSFAAINGGLVDFTLVATVTGGVIKGHTTGPSVDNGTWRAVPVLLTEVSGVSPANNEKVSLTAKVTL